MHEPQDSMCIMIHASRCDFITIHCDILRYSADFTENVKAELINNLPARLGPVLDIIEYFNICCLL